MPEDIVRRPVGMAERQELARCATERWRMWFQRHTGTACPADLDAAWAKASVIQRRLPDRTPIDMLCAVSVAGCAAGVLYIAAATMDWRTPWVGMALTFALAVGRSWRYFRRLPE